MATMSTDELLDVFKNMTVLELNDFLKKFEEEFDVTAAPRAVLRESVRLLYRVLGDRRMGNARANAWAAFLRSTWTSSSVA